MGRGRIATLAAIVFAGSSLSHCVGATEIMVVLRTDVACPVVDTNGVTIAVGDGTGEPTGIVASSKGCDAGALGTLALTPHGDIGGLVALRVVLGVNAHAEDCSPQDKYSGCIVARRSLRYSPHAELSLPIDLDQDCLDDPCGPDSTCVHGACTDAGVECDGNVCGIDAGPPGCSATSAIISSTSAVATPHIARAAAGYVIAWMPSPGAIEVEIVDASGKIVSQPVAVTVFGSPVKLDAVAIDSAQQTYFVVHEENGITFGSTVSVSGATTNGAQFAGAAGPSSGAFWDPSQQIWITAGTKNNVASFFTVSGTFPNVATQISAAAPTGLALSRFGSTYYPTVVEGSNCVVRSCALQPNATFGCSPTATLQGCSAVRAAASASNVVLSYVSQSTLVFQNAVGGFAVPDGPVDDLEAMVPLVVGSTPYRIVWRTTDVIVTDTFPTKQIAVENLDSSGFTGAGAGFDAVADDPAQTSYAVVYYKAGSPSGSIRLIHRCK